MNDDVLYEIEVRCVSGNRFSSHNTIFGDSEVHMSVLKTILEAKVGYIL